MEKVIIAKLSDKDIREKGIPAWPVWEKEVSRFYWEYEEDEECLVLEGEVDVETEAGTFTIREGDFVTFKKGLKCTRDVRKAIRKQYNFPAG